MENLINLDKVGDIFINLTNKLADGVGWIVNRETPTKIAVKTYIEDIQNSNYDGITKAALISQAKKTIKEYCNQNEIVKIAIGAMHENAKPENVDNDWLAQFMDKARLISDKQFQWIWGRILALECEEQNCIPRGLLHILEQMDKKDAERFLAICSVSVYTDEEVRDFHPIVVAEHLDDYYSSVGVQYNDLVDLQALGLIEVKIGALDVGYHTKIEGDYKTIIIKYFDESFELPEGLDHFSVGNVIFTRAGQALCRSITVNKQENFWGKCCIPMWEKDAMEYSSKREENVGHSLNAESK